MCAKLFRSVRWVLLLMLLVGNHSDLMAEEVPYRISWYHGAGSIDLGDIRGLDFKLLSDATKLPTMDNSGSYLFRIELERPAAAGGLVLYIENEHLDTVSLYGRQGNSLVLLKRKGNNFPQVLNRFGAPDFNLPEGGSVYYVLIRFKKDVSFRAMIGTPDGMNRWSTSVFFQLGLYYGTCLMFLVLNLFLYFYLKDRLFLYYALFFVFISLSIAYADGLFSFLTSNSWLLNHADVPLHLGMGLSCTLFARRFLSLERSRMRGIGFVALGLALMVYLFSWYLNSYRLFLLGELLVIGLLGFFWVLALGQFRVAMHARFFVYGYGLFLFCAIDYFLLRKVGIFTFDLYYGQLKTGSWIELVVITLAIMYRIRDLDRQNRYYRREIEQLMHSAMEQQHMAQQKEDDFFAGVAEQYGLSDRELEVLRGIAEGLSNTQIADMIFLSVNTVKFHTRNIFDKMEITSRTQAIGKVLGTSRSKGI